MSEVSRALLEAPAHDDVEARRMLQCAQGVFDGEGFLGKILHAFIGYHDEPNLLQVFAYFGYLGAMGTAFLRAVRTPRPEPAGYAVSSTAVGRRK